MSELERLRAVVAVQREALQAIQAVAVMAQSAEDTERLAWLREIEDRARAALDAEGVSEPGSSAAVVDTDATPQDGDGPETVGERQGRQPGSLTSPVDTAPQGAKAWRNLPTPRGYVEHGPGGPQAVYHAETPDDYLEHGDVGFTPAPSTGRGRGRKDV